MGDSININWWRKLVSTLFVESHNHDASCRKAPKWAVEWNRNRLRRPIARVDGRELKQTAFIKSIVTSDNLAFMRPKKCHLNEQGYETQLEKSV